MFLRPSNLAIAAVVLAMLVAPACGGSELPESADATPIAPTPINPQTVLMQSGEVMENLRSFHFRLHHEKGSIAFLGGIVIEEAEGDAVTPGELFVSFSGTFGTGFALKSSLITLGDAAYVTDALTGEWRAGPPNVSALGFFDPHRGIASMMSQVAQVYLLEDGDGERRPYRLGGELPAAALAPLVGTTLEGATVQVELTIDPEGMFLVGARFIGQVKPTDGDDFVRVITLSAFNEPISIEAPL